MRPVTGWRVCMYYRKLNSWTENDHFPMPFMDQMLDRLERKGLQPNLYCTRRSRQTHFYLSLWNFRVQEDALR
uniref:Uncharacterized protein n=1 Tax=Solanum lycopersicum TaxID=4081 RepID=A0A3Q7IFS2_SOLLC